MKKGSEMENRRKGREMERVKIGGMKFLAGACGFREGDRHPWLVGYIRGLHAEFGVCGRRQHSSNNV